MAVSGQRIGKRANNNIGTFGGGVSVGPAPRLYDEDPRPAEGIFAGYSLDRKYLRAGSWERLLEKT